MLQSARGPIANVAELVAGEPIQGSWWGHPRNQEIFDTLNTLSESPDVVRLRIVRGKVTLVHRRLWAALVTLSDEFTAAQLAAIREEHTSSGAHHSYGQPFPEWVPAEVIAEAASLSRDEALARLPSCIDTRRR